MAKLPDIESPVHIRRPDYDPFDFQKDKEYAVQPNRKVKALPGWTMIDYLVHQGMLKHKNIDYPLFPETMNRNIFARVVLWSLLHFFYNNPEGQLLKGDLKAYCMTKGYRYIEFSLLVAEIRTRCALVQRKHLKVSKSLADLVLKDENPVLIDRAVEGKLRVLRLKFYGQNNRIADLLFERTFNMLGGTWFSSHQEQRTKTMIYADEQAEKTKVKKIPVAYIIRPLPPLFELMKKVVEEDVLF